MGLVSNTGLLATVTPSKNSIPTQEKASIPELRFDVSPAPFILRPYAGIYNPFSQGCSVLCNHPADRETKEFVKRFKDAWMLEGKTHNFHEEFSKFQDASGSERDKNKMPHDLVTEDMFRRYAETDSRPLTPAPTLASGKSRGSRRCLTPDQPHPKTTIVVDLRRSHSQETLYYHGHTTSDITPGQQTTSGNELSLPSLTPTDKQRGSKSETEQLPALASPVVLTARAMKVNRPEANKTQLKALNLGKPVKGKKEKAEKGGPSPATERSKESLRTEASDAVDAHVDDNAETEIRRRGKRRRRGRAAGSDRLTSAGLAAHAQQDPETQIAGIGGDSHNPSSRGSIAQLGDEDFVIPPPVTKSATARKTDSFLDDDILKFLHREVDEDAIETEFNVKRRYVLEEAFRTRSERPMGDEMRALLRELGAGAGAGAGARGGLADWLHVPRVFSRTNAHFSLPIDSNQLKDLTPMQYAARHVTLKKSKQLLYMTVLRKFRPTGYRMPIKDIPEGLMLMMGGLLSTLQARQFAATMQWERHEDDTCPDDLRVTLLDTGCRRFDAGDMAEPEVKTLKYRTWCGLCAICERMYGRFPPREKDLPDGIELSDFTSLETKLATLPVHPGLAEILNVIRTR